MGYRRALCFLCFAIWDQRYQSREAFFFFLFSAFRLFGRGKEGTAGSALFECYRTRIIILNSIACQSRGVCFVSCSWLFCFGR